LNETDSITTPLPSQKEDAGFVSAKALTTPLPSRKEDAGFVSAKALTTPLHLGDWLLAGAGLVLLGSLWLRQADSLEGRVVIRLDGKVFQEASLRLNRVIEVAGPLGISRVEIRAGRVRVAADPSPRQLCVRQGWIPSGAAAVCLPNRVSVENAAAGYDTLNY
jgi:hypothetical protein